MGHDPPAIPEADEPSVDTPLAVGARVLDRYVVLEQFDSGGTSVVYRGEDERLARPVCIKVFSSLRDKEWLYQTSYQHFVQEAFALSKLSHPNTLRIYDFGHLPDTAGGAEGPPFQISEFMNGGTLSHVVRREGPMPVAEARAVVGAICGALDEAHHADIIHRDIKPKNILFGTTGQTRQPKLADFGIAKSLALDTDALRNRAGDTQVVAGRRLLMFSGLWAAPEQLSSQPVSPATDIYSWALVTIFMLTGQSVFSTNDPSQALRQRHDWEPMIDEALRHSSFPPAVAALLKQACDFAPARRPQSAGGFAAALLEAFDRKAGARRLPLPPAAETAPGEEPGGETTHERDTLDLERAVPAAPPAAPAAAPPTLAALPSPPGAAGALHGPPRRLPLSADGQPVGDRTGRFVALADLTADLICASGRARVRVTLIPTSGTEFSFHVRGLNCFVKRTGARPSSATQLEASGGIELLAANQAALGSAQVVFASPAAGHHVFSVGDELIALGASEIGGAVVLDFGPGGECLFVYVPRPGHADPGGRRRER